MRGRHRAVGHQVGLGIGCFLRWHLVMMAMVMSVIVRERSRIIAHGCFLPRICIARWNARQDPATDDTKGTLLTGKARRNKRSLPSARAVAHPRPTPIDACRLGLFHGQ